jgi:hypothetical protein
MLGYHILSFIVVGVDDYNSLRNRAFFSVLEHCVR